MRKLFIVFALLCATASCYADTTAVPAPPPPASPEDFNSMFGTGSSDGLNGKYDKGIAELTKAVSLATTNDQKAMVLLQIGNMYLIQKKFAEARANYDKVLATNKINPSLKASTWMPYAESYSQEGKYHEARAAYNKILSMKDVPLSFHFYAQRKKIETYLSAKQYVQARKESEKLNSYNKIFAVTSVVAAYYIGESYLDEGNFETARKQFAKAIGVKENDLQVEDSFLFEIYQQQASLGIALSYFNQKQYGKAKEEYAKIVKMNCWGKFKSEAANEIRVIDNMQKNWK
jgi:tetratricopeptide (TPR) repeat protein